MEMQTVQTLQTLVGSVGFPIVACAALFWSNHQMGKRHRDEIKELTDVMERNTEALIAITEVIRKGEK